ncbi:MAG: hypothetical protein ACTSWP_06665 [Candidatus Freyarchaeota archaeon]|nr:hypothetical protein [Candidatus Freyrarchaeum guaymaensis]
MEELRAAALSPSSYGIELHPLRGELAEKTVEVAVDMDVTV